MKMAIIEPVTVANPDVKTECSSAEVRSGNNGVTKIVDSVYTKSRIVPGPLMSKFIQISWHGDLSDAYHSKNNVGACYDTFSRRRPHDELKSIADLSNNDLRDTKIVQHAYCCGKEGDRSADL